MSAVETNLIFYFLVRLPDKQQQATSRKSRGDACGWHKEAGCSFLFNFCFAVFKRLFSFSFYFLRFLPFFAPSVLGK